MSAPTTLPIAPGTDVVENGAHVEKATWEPRFWDNDHFVALRFDASELDAAIDWLWSLPEMRHLPRIHVGENTMAIPAQAAPRFAKQGFRFTVCPVISAGDLSAEELKRLRNGADA